MLPQWRTSFLSECDSPLALVDHTFDYIESHWSKDVDFVVWTGDNARHDIDSALPRSLSEIYDSNRALARRFEHMFERHGIPVVPSLGNNDIYPHNIIRAGPNPITSEFAKIWQPFIPADQYHTVTRGIYFAREVIPDTLAVVSMNTMYYFDNNKVVDGCTPDDPGTLQLDWLLVQLGRWRERGMQVWLTGHVPPSNWYEGCKSRYAEIAVSYQDTIVGQMFGHVNVDTFSYLTSTPPPDDKKKRKKHKKKHSKPGFSTFKFTHNDLFSTFQALPKRLKLEDYSIVHTSPSVIPTYLPSLRIWHYNTTGEPYVQQALPAGLTPDQEVSRLRNGSELDAHYTNEEVEEEEEETSSWLQLILRRRKHRKKKKRPAPRLPRHFSPASPSRTNRFLTPLAYDQYYLPHANWTLEYSTELDDLTIGSWLGFAKQLTKHKKLWKQYVRRMYVGAIDPQQ